MRSIIYKWHRRFSIIIAIPVLLWAVSGFMHPLMTNIRPAIATQQLVPGPIDSSRIRLSLQTALSQHHIDSIAGFRLVHIDTNYFYQVRPAWNASNAPGPASGVPVYLSCTNGNVLTAGDWLYAQYLARQFLEGPTKQSHHTGMASMTMPAPASSHDCCGSAADYVLNASKGAPVANVSLLKTFDPEYKSINRLLPVYKVSFQRADGIRVYVETTQDRFAFAMDNKRALFDNIFRLFHTYGWLEWMGKGRLVVELFLALLALITTFMGIYIFCVTSTKPAKGNPRQRARRNHRIISIIAALFTCLWTFSGAYHAFSKFQDDTRDQYFVRDNFPAGALSPDWTRLQTLAAAPLTNIGIVKMNNANYYRVTTTTSKVLYYSASDYSFRSNGDARYADDLATRFSGQPPTCIDSTSFITAFGDEYNFTDKRLPVWKVNYTNPVRERFYIETSTGRLASRVDDRAVREGWSFSVFHKHHFMDWGGKPARDASTMFWAFAQLLMVTIGLILFFSTRKRRVSRIQINQ